MIDDLDDEYTILTAYSLCLLWLMESRDYILLATTKIERENKTLDIGHYKCDYVVELLIRYG